MLAFVLRSHPRLPGFVHSRRPIQPKGDRRRALPPDRSRWIVEPCITVPTNNGPTSLTWLLKPAMIYLAIHRSKAPAMHGVVSTLTAACLFVHMAVGCCWHPVPARAQASAAVRTTGRSHASCCRHTHEREEGHSSTPTCPESPDYSCHEDNCSVVITSPQHEMTIKSLPSTFVVAPASATYAGQTLTQSSLLSICLAPWISGPPLRLHLLNQLLLI